MTNTILMCPKQPLRFNEALSICRGDFPGGLVAKILCFQCRGPGFDPQLGNWILRAATDTWCSQINTFFKKYSVHSTFIALWSILHIQKIVEVTLLCVVVFKIIYYLYMAFAFYFLIGIYANFHEGIWEILYQLSFSMVFLSIMNHFQIHIL